MMKITKRKWDIFFTLVLFACGFDGSIPAGVRIGLAWLGGLGLGFIIEEWRHDLEIEELMLKDRLEKAIAERGTVHES